MAANTPPINLPFTAPDPNITLPPRAEGEPYRGLIVGTCQGEHIQPRVAFAKFDIHGRIRFISGKHDIKGRVLANSDKKNNQKINESDVTKLREFCSMSRVDLARRVFDRYVADRELPMGQDGWLEFLHLVDYRYTATPELKNAARAQWLAKHANRQKVTPQETGSRMTNEGSNPLVASATQSRADGRRGVGGQGVGVSRPALGEGTTMATSTSLRTTQGPSVIQSGPNVERRVTFTTENTNSSNLGLRPFNRHLSSRSWMVARLHITSEERPTWAPGGTPLDTTTLITINNNEEYVRVIRYTWLGLPQGALAPILDAPHQRDQFPQGAYYATNSATPEVRIPGGSEWDVVARVEIGEYIFNRTTRYTLSPRS